MIHPHARKTIAKRLTVVTAAIVSGNMALPARANAAPPTPPGPAPSNHHHVGNGHHNRNILTVRSPTHNHGYQHTNSSNAGGVNNVQNALCRHSTVCNITQKITVITPEKPAPPTETPPPTGATPPITTPPPIGAPGETGIVQPQVMATTKPKANPKPPPPAAAPSMPTPFMYMGPYGFLMVAPDSSAPVGFRSDGIGSFGLPTGLLS